MKIVFVSDVIYPFVKGGAEKRIFEITKRLAARGHEVHVYGIQWWDGPAVFTQDQITYHGVCKKKALYTNGRRSIIEAIWFALCLLIPLARERFDIIDCNQHPYFPLFVCRAIATIKRKRFVATWHEYWGDYWYEYLGKAGLMGYWIEKIGTRMPDRIIAVSERTAAALMSAGVPGRKVLVVTNGIPYQYIQQVKPASEACDVLFAGRLIKDKHIDVLLGACAIAARERQIRLAVFGAGPEKEGLEKLARELGISGSTEFGGFLEEEELIARMKAARVFVLPSSREGFSITTLEAMACGLPVITVNCPNNYATDLIIEGSTGRITGLDEKELAAAIVSMLADETLRQRMTVDCRTAAAKYDWDLLGLEIERLYLSEIDKQAR